MSGTASNYFDKLCLQQTLLNFNLKLALYTNNVTPVTGSVFSDFTLCTATGYSDQTLTAGNWTFTDDTSDSYATQPTQTFTFTSSTTVYGYIIYNSSGNQYWCGELFSDGPYTFGSTGGSVVIDPKILIG